MSSSKHIRKVSDSKLMEGTEKHFGKNGSVVIGREKVTGAELVRLLKARIAAIDKVDAAHAAWRSAVEEELAGREASDSTLLLYRKVLLLQFAGHREALADFGLEPPKKARRLTDEERAAANAQRKATRAARHTMGKRERLAIRGVVAQPAAVTSAPAATNGTAPFANGPPPATSGTPPVTNGAASSTGGNQAH